MEPDKGSVGMTAPFRKRTTPEVYSTSIQMILDAIWVFLSLKLLTSLSAVVGIVSTVIQPGFSSPRKYPWIFHPTYHGMSTSSLGPLLLISKSFQASLVPSTDYGQNYLHLSEIIHQFSSRKHNRSCGRNFGERAGWALPRSCGFYSNYFSYCYGRYLPTAFKADKKDEIVSLCLIQDWLSPWLIMAPCRLWPRPASSFALPAM